MLLRLRLRKKWGEYAAGSVVDFGEGKGRPLIANGTAELADENEKLVKVKSSPETDLIRLRLLKKYGNYEAGSVVDFGERKGRPLVESGMAVEVSKKEKKIVVKPKKKKIETASMNRKAEADAKAKVKAEADAEAKAKAKPKASGKK